mgnify:CR=1 FL=1
MELPINDQDLDTIVNALALGGDARLYHLLKEVKDVRDNNPDGPYKKILRDKGICLLYTSDAADDC